MQDYTEKHYLVDKLEIKKNSFVLHLEVSPTSSTTVTDLQPGAPVLQNSWDRVRQGSICTQDLGSTTEICARGEPMNQGCWHRCAGTQEGQALTRDSKTNKHQK